MAPAGNELVVKVNPNPVEPFYMPGMTQGDVVRYSFDKPEPLKVEHEQFRDKILNGEGSIVTVAEGCETVRVADAMVKSSQENQVIFLK